MVLSTFPSFSFLPAVENPATDLQLPDGKMEARYMIFLGLHPSFIAQPGLGTNYLPHAAPPNYKYKGTAKANYATQLKTLSAFYDSFDPKDQRRQVFLTEYDDLSGKHILLGKDDKRSFKFEGQIYRAGEGQGQNSI